MTGRTGLNGFRIFHQPPQPLGQPSTEVSQEPLSPHPGGGGLGKVGEGGGGHYFPGVWGVTNLSSHPFEAPPAPSPRRQKVTTDYLFFTQWACKRSHNPQLSKNLIICQNPKFIKWHCCKHLTSKHNTNFVHFLTLQWYDHLTFFKLLGFKPTGVDLYDTQNFGGLLHKNVIFNVERATYVFLTKCLRNLFLLK